MRYQTFKAMLRQVKEAPWLLIIRNTIYTVNIESLKVTTKMTAVVAYSFCTYRCNLLKRILLVYSLTKPVFTILVMCELQLSQYSLVLFHFSVVPGQQNCVWMLLVDYSPSTCGCDDDVLFTNSP